jgi:hypothetical protein
MKPSDEIVWKKEEISPYFEIFHHFFPARANSSSGLFSVPPCLRGCLAKRGREELSDEVD